MSDYISLRWKQLVKTRKQISNAWFIYRKLSSSLVKLQAVKHRPAWKHAVSRVLNSETDTNLVLLGFYWTVHEFEHSLVSVLVTRASPSRPMYLNTSLITRKCSERHPKIKALFSCDDLVMWLHKIKNIYLTRRVQIMWPRTKNIYDLLFTENQKYDSPSKKLNFPQCALK